MVVPFGVVAPLAAVVPSRGVVLVVRVVLGGATVVGTGRGTSLYWQSGLKEMSSIATAVLALLRNPSMMIWKGVAMLSGWVLSSHSGPCWPALSHRVLSAGPLLRVRNLILSLLALLP